MFLQALPSSADPDPPGGMYEIDCTDTDCRELMIVAAKHCPDALLEIEAELGRKSRK